MEALSALWEGRPESRSLQRSGTSGMNTKEHIINKKCPAKVCRALLKYESFPTCAPCAEDCAKAAGEGDQWQSKDKERGGHSVQIDEGKCPNAGMCFESCKFDAVEVA